MNEEKITFLEKEVARLNLIIDALVFQNEALKLGYSVTEKNNAPPELGYSVSEKGNGIIEAGYSIHEKSNGRTEAGYSISEKGNGTTETGYSVTEKVNGITDNRYSVTEKVNGITELLRTLPEKVEPTPDNVLKLNKRLRAMDKGKVKRSGSINSAKLLIHFHNQNSGAHPGLRKLTNLSKGGLGKLIMSLTRRGLIVRDGWQKFALTPSAKKLMSEAFG